MRLFKAGASVVFIVALPLAGFYAGTRVASVDANQAETLEQRVDDLEVRVTLLEATVAADTGADPSITPASANNTITGEYQELPASHSGDSCTSFYAPGVNVFISDWEGTVLGTTQLGEGTLLENGMCSQPFVFDDIPVSDGYVINFERRVPASAYEFTQDDVESNSWHIIVTSRYRN